MLFSISIQSLANSLLVLKHFVPVRILLTLHSIWLLYSLSLLIAKAGINRILL